MIYLLSAIMGSFFPIIAIILSIMAISRSNRAISEIEKMKKGAYSNETVQVVSSAAMETATPTETETIMPVSGNIVPPAPAVAEEESAFMKWLKEDWLLKLGGILVIMGILFLLSITFNSMGPQGKTMLGYLIGAVLMMFGFWFAKRNLIGGSVIHVVGAISVIITTYVAQVSYNMFDSFLSMLLMFFTSAIVSLTAYVYKRASMAHVGLLLALIVPVLVGGRGSFLDLLLYLSMVTLGVLWLAIATQWRTLVLLSQIALCLYSSPYAFGAANLQSMETMMIILFGGVFFITSVFSILRSQGKTVEVDGWIALLNGFYALGWIFAEVPGEWQSIVLALVAIVYAIAFFFVYKSTKAYTGFVIYAGVSFALLVIAVMVELSGPAETVALTLMIAGATVLAHYLSKDSKAAWITALVNILPLMGLFYSINRIASATRAAAYSASYGSTSSYGYANQYLNERVWQDFTALGIAIVTYALVAYYFRSRVKDISVIAFFVSAILAIDVIWQVLHFLIPGNFATFLSLIIYAVAGLIVLFQGSKTNNAAMLRVGKIGLGLVALRVILVDAWTLGSTTVGIVVCVVIGLLLLSSTFITKKANAAAAH